uniref:Beta-catenin-like protein 1 n=1 Tax=Sinocyclocheilus grahami TaxID=75366 RepID=A0A672P108_SINGR
QKAGSNPGRSRQKAKGTHFSISEYISIVVVDLLQELTDIDTLHESEEGAEVLIDALLEGQVVALMVQNMERLDETVKEEADGVYNTLGKEKMAECFSKAVLCVRKTASGLSLQVWFWKDPAKMPFDANKLYCSEILVFKRHNPTTAEEQEMMENLFDALCSCLMLPANRDRFLRGEGLQLMNLMLREKKMSRVSALKVLDYGMIGPEGSDNCHKFVDILGLRTIFPLFMKTPKKMKKVGISDKEHEGLLCSDALFSPAAAFSLFLCCSSVDRLMELHFKYLEAVQLADKRIEGEKHDMVRRGEIIDDAMDDEFYLRRLDAGLFVLQLVCYIMVEICNAGVPQLQQRVHQILNLRGGSVKIVRHIMREYAENIGDGKSEEFKESEQKRILELLENF